MKSLPILLRNPRILLIGGGKVALQKATVMSANDIDFEIISREYISEFKSLHVKKFTREFCIEDTQEFGFVIDATGNEKVTKELINNKIFLLNVVDKPEYSTPNVKTIFSKI